MGVFSWGIGSESFPEEEDFLSERGVKPKEEASQLDGSNSVSELNEAVSLPCTV